MPGYLSLFDQCISDVDDDRLSLSRHWPCDYLAKIR